MLKEGTKAPDFTLYDQDGKPHSLTDYRGSKVILYFYSKDMTSGCSAQACGFNVLYPEIIEKNAVVLGISRDSAERHKRFQQKYSLKFTLLSDENEEVIEKYETTRISHTKNGDKKVYVRTTYLIDEAGMIVKAMGKVKPAQNPIDVLEAINQM